MISPRVVVWATDDETINPSSLSSFSFYIRATADRDCGRGRDRNGDGGGGVCDGGIGEGHGGGSEGGGVQTNTPTYAPIRITELININKGSKESHECHCFRVILLS